MSDPFAALRSEDHDAVIAFLRFFRSKRDLSLQTVEAEFHDAQADRLVDEHEVFSTRDVEDVLSGLKDVVMHSVRADMSRSVNMMALLVKQMMGSAAEQGAELSLNMTEVEDKALLDAVEKMNLDMRRATVAGAKLTSLKDEHHRLQRETDRLSSSNATLQQRYDDLEAESAAMRKERANLREEVAALKNQLRLARGDVAEAKGENDQYKGESMEKEAKLLRDVEAERAAREAAEQETTKRVNETKQFSQLKNVGPSPEP
mmetsp:Transcript_8843/g.25705  ORF Transcript_8843/g.25705 Transcript_8843/m.25705 type:complete len:260 (-) Transcript_8843:112-891(-)